MANAADATAGRRQGVARRFSLAQLLALIAAGPTLVILAAVVVGILTISHQNSVRNELVGRVQPADALALRLEVAMLNQETGIRGYELAGAPALLAPYHLGVSQEHAEEPAIRADAATLPDVATLLARLLGRIHTWEADVAIPALSQRPGTTAGPSFRVDTTLAAKQRFDGIRAALNPLLARLASDVQSTHQALNRAATATAIVLAVIGVALLASMLGAAILLSRLVTRPIGRLAAGARQVAGGDLTHSVALGGPRDLELLSEDVDAMRRGLLTELTSSQRMQAALAGTAAELQRSNTELEQFAYVASHDLQEPLRKVTSFCQLLESRYSEQLDERGLQYIDFAVDGAKRMQQLVNDLLAFSRVGRQGGDLTPADLNSLAASAVADLQAAISDSGAEVSVGQLPTLAVKPALIRAVFQNLVANAIKFRGEDPPRVEIGARREGANWEFACADNGIGIESEYAERIFVIFQRLHTREAYPGTGIGLAMCRKIVEHHGGTMWLDTTYTGGTRMCFTLPAEPEPAATPTIGA